MTSAEGERVIPGTRRPDGTMRKERKIRPGYVPQEEQQVYVSRGAAFRDAAKDHVPGMDKAALAAARAAITAANKSKAAKKNEKRKEKKAAEKSAVPTGGVSAAAASMQRLGISGEVRGDASSAAAPSPPAASGAPATDEAAVEKQIRALKKKLRQCEVFQREQDAGQELTSEEQKKLDRVEEWRAELAGLEQQ